MTATGRTFGRWAALAAAACIAAGLGACSTVTSIKLFSVTVHVVDEKDQPIANAYVQTTDGQKTSTDAQGDAQIKFGVAGIHVLHVAGENKSPATLNVTMPMDINKKFTVRLVPTVNISAGINVNLMIGQLYPMLFQMMFSAYGYNMELVPFKAGEWTEWKVASGSGRKDPLTMRKAYLTTQSEGQQWWQMILVDRKDKGNDITMEVMFSRNRESLRRMRQQTGKKEPGEVPVTEGWYTPPMQLTKESMNGATVSRGVSVTVPAGTFTADVLEFSLFGGGGKLRMWRVAGVPGGIVKTEVVSENKSSTWTSELAAKGTGAKTLLSSY